MVLAISIDILHGNFHLYESDIVEKQVNTRMSIPENVDLCKFLRNAVYYTTR